MNAFAKRALFSYGSVTQTKADTADSHELVKLLFQGLTDFQSIQGIRYRIKLR